jgi:hypothetical protein
MHRQLAVFVGAAIAAGLAGCAPHATPIGPGQVYQPDEREQRLWRTGEGFSNELQGSGKLYHDPVVQQYVQTVLNRLIGEYRSAYVPLKVRVFVVEAPSINAFALPQGDIYLHTGILSRMRSEAQLAMVLGHEITHSTHRHSYLCNEQAYAQSGTLSYISVMSTVGGGNIQNVVNSIGTLMATAAVSGYGREKEREADQVGLALVAQAGYDPAEGAKMFQQMLEATDKADRNWSLFYATHPRMKERVADSSLLITQLPAELASQAKDIGRERYVAVCGPLIYDEVERHIAQGKYVLAEETLKYLAGVAPSALTRAYFGDLYRARWASGDDVRARTAYDEALAADGRCAPAHRGLGLLLAKSGDKAGAVGQLRQYLAAAGTAKDAGYIQQYVNQLSKAN